MKHRIKTRKFGKTRSQQKTIMKNLFRSLILKKEVKTTLPKAKELKIFTERVISRCQSKEFLKNKALLRLISPSLVPKVKKIAKRYENRRGGFVSIVKLTAKRRDNGSTARIRLV